MKKIHAVAVIICVFCFCFETLTDSECLAGRMREDTVSLKEGINEMRDSRLYYAADFWPSAHPSDAVSAAIKRSSVAKEDFRIYGWREAGDTWVEIEPQPHSTPFICGTDFRVIQNDTEFFNVRLETSDGFSQCGYVYRASIFRLTLRSSLTMKADFSLPFTLVYEGASAGTYRLVIPGAPSTSALPSRQACRYLTLRESGRGDVKR